MLPCILFSRRLFNTIVLYFVRSSFKLFLAAAYFGRSPLRDLPDGQEAAKPLKETGRRPLNEPL
jgi:hypothetical protein